MSRMLRRLFLPLCLSTALLGCSSLGGESRHHPTVASLKRQRAIIDAEQHIDNAREKAAETYRQALETSANPKMEAEALRRLADIELQRAEEELLDTERAPSGQEFAAAIEAYQSLLRLHPDNEANDKVLYQLARAQENAALNDDALASLDLLVSQYPVSAYIQEAQFRRGEMLFLARRYHDAELAYAEVVQTEPRSAFHAPAMYKHGWSLFKQSLHDEALDSFFDLMDSTLVSNAAVRNIESMSRPEQELLEDTLRAVSISLSYFARPEDVDTWLAKRKPPYFYMVYASLADLYFAQERYADAAHTARAFVRAHPDDPRAPSFQSRVIATWQKGKFPGRELEAKADFVSSYVPDANYWAANNAADMSDVSKKVQAYLRDLAGHHHARYQALSAKAPAASTAGPGSVASSQRTAQTRDNADKQNERALAASKAVGYYQSSLKHYPAADDAGETSFLMAELLFDSARFDEAAAAYEQAAYRYPSFDRQAEAAYAALLAYDAHEKTLAEPARAQWQQQSLASALKFAGQFPDHPEANAVLTGSAEDVFARGDLVQAVKLTDRVLKSKLSVAPAVRVTALTVSGHARFDLQDYAGAQAAYQTVLAELADTDKRRPALTERLASSVYKQGEVSRDSGDLAAAAKAFHQVAKLAPDSEIRTLADYDAAAMLIRLEDWTSASTALSQFLTRNPKHELAGQVQKDLVMAYQNGGDLAAAAAELEKISALSNDPAEQEATQWQAAQFYVQADASKQAIAAYENYVSRFDAQFESAMEARQTLVSLNAKAGNNKQVTRWQKSIVSADAAAGDARTVRTRTLAAHASLALAEPVLESFRSHKLVAPLKKNLKEKKRRMEKALVVMAAAAELGITEVTTRATFETAGIYRSMGAALMDSQRPKGMSAEQREQYEIVLEEQAFPFEEKAIELHEVNVARLNDGIYDAWVQASLDALGELMPARYAKRESSEVAVAQIH